MINNIKKVQRGAAVPRFVRVIQLMLISLFLMVGCGQKGSLYLPDASHAIKAKK